MCTLFILSVNICFMKKILLSILFIALSAEFMLNRACTEGLATGNITVDGRPIHWKLRMWFGTNRLTYWDNDKNNDGIPDQDNDRDGKPDPFSFLGIRSNTNEFPNFENPMMGLNSAGFSIGITIVGETSINNSDPLMTRPLANFSTMEQFRSFLSSSPGVFDDEIDNWTCQNTYGIMDKAGECAEFEYEKHSPDKVYWREYNAANPKRRNQKMETGTHFGDIVAKANFFHHSEISGANMTDAYKEHIYRDRYTSATHLMANLRDKKNLSILSLLQGSDPENMDFSDIVLRRSIISQWQTNCSAMLIQGAKKEKDPRLSIFWALMGHSDFTVAVPVWILGVESDANQKPPHCMETDIHTQSLAAVANGIHDKYNHQFDKLHEYTFPFERHAIQAVQETLLPHWSTQDWKNKSTVDKIGVEMNRVQNQMAKNAFSLLSFFLGTKPPATTPIVLYRNKIKNALITFSIPALKIQLTKIQANTAHFDLQTKTNASNVVWNYGDGQTGSQATHQYSKAGSYLVSCTITSTENITQTDWLYVEIN